MGAGPSYLSAPVTVKKSVSGVSFTATEMQGWRVNMEDANVAIEDFGQNPSVSLFAVFDGHGGREVAEYVKRHFPAELLKSKEYRAGSIKAALSTTFMRMDTLLKSDASRRELRSIEKGYRSQQSSPVSSPKKALAASSSPDPKLKPGSESETAAKDAYSEGCTANVVLIKNKMLYSANAGDSKAMLITAEGTGIELTVDHKPGLEGESDRIRKAGGSVVNGRVNGDLNVSRSLGDLRYKTNKMLKPEEQLISAQPDLTTQSLSDGVDYVLLGSDGLFGLKSVQDIADFITKDRKAFPYSELSATTEKLLDQLISPNCVQTNGVGGDNMTCILINVKEL